jgi:hypothetical protein
VESIRPNSLSRPKALSTFKTNVFRSSQGVLRRSSFHDDFVTVTGGGVKVAVNHLVPWSG